MTLPCKDGRVCITNVSLKVLSDQLQSYCLKLDYNSTSGGKSDVRYHFNFSLCLLGAIFHIFLSVTGFKGIVVNWVLQSLHGGSLEITLVQSL